MLLLLLWTPALVYSMTEEAADKQSIIELGNGCSGASLYVTDNTIIPLVLFDKEEDGKDDNDGDGDGDGNGGDNDFVSYNFDTKSDINVPSRLVPHTMPPP